MRLQSRNSDQWMRTDECLDDLIFMNYFLIQLRILKPYIEFSVRLHSTDIHKV